MIFFLLIKINTKCTSERRAFYDVLHIEISKYVPGMYSSSSESLSSSHKSANVRDILVTESTEGSYKL